MMNSMYVTLLKLLPGLGHLYRKQYIHGVFDLSCFILIIFIGYIFLSTDSIFFVLLAMISTAYRMAYAEYLSTSFLQRAKKIEWHKFVEPQDMIILVKPRWWINILNWPWLYIITILVVVFGLSKETEVSWLPILNGFSGAMDMVKGFLSPDWSHLPDALKYVLQTVEIAILGTLGGILIAVPMSVLSARNIMQSTRFMSSVYYIARWWMSIVRAMPTFLLGLIFVAWVGLGPFPGVLAITVFSSALMTKMLSEAIESINSGPIEAAIATGANQFHVILFSVFPQLPAVFIAISLYCLEINIHSATVLGLIGAQGIGMPIHEYLSSLAYSSAAVYILVVIVITVGTDYMSGFMRSIIK